MAEKTINSRVVHKHDIEANWLKATGFYPKQGEIIVYDIDDTYGYERFKIGDGKSLVSDLPFAYDALASDISAISDKITNIEFYILNIDYDAILAFDTSEIIFGTTSTTSVLGQAILGQMVLA